MMLGSRFISVKSLGVLGFFTYARITVACSCGYITAPSVAQKLASADAVFLAELVDEEPDFEPLYRFTPDRNLTFRVIASWKGVTGTDVGLVTEAGGSFASCGFFGVIGREYLLYARKDPDSDKLRVKLCTFRQGESAEIETAALDAITTRLQLVTGDDPTSPPEEIRFALCGLGTVMALSVSLLFLVTQRCHSVRRQ